jgi:hypothetical protein
MNNANEFTVTFEDQRFRTYRATFLRAARGTFPKLTKIERYKTNGKDFYWSVHRPCCDGSLEKHVVEKIKEMAKVIRHQA